MLNLDLYTYTNVRKIKTHNEMLDLYLVGLCFKITAVTKLVYIAANKTIM